MASPLALSARPLRSAFVFGQSLRAAQSIPWRSSVPVQPASSLSSTPSFCSLAPIPAPFFTNPVRPQVADPTPTSATTPPAPAPAPPRPVEATAAVHPPPAARPQAPTARRNDPIAELIGSSIGSPSRVLAVQRALSEFGYGQIKASGTLDQSTTAAIEKFEGEHKLPVTGRISDRLLNELATMTGHPLQ